MAVPRRSRHGAYPAVGPGDRAGAVGRRARPYCVGRGACAGCVIALGLFGQLVEVHNASVADELEKVCTLFPEGPVRSACDAMKCNANKSESCGGADTLLVYPFDCSSEYEVRGDGRRG